MSKSPAYSRHGLRIHGSSVPTGGTPGWANPIYFCWPCAAPEKNTTANNATSTEDPSSFFTISFSLKLLAVVDQKLFAISANAVHLCGKSGANLSAAIGMSLGD
jgi:hypothetical protein